MDMERRMDHSSAHADAAKVRALVENIEEWEEFAWHAMHALRNPLRSLIHYPQKLANDYGGSLDAQANAWIDKTIAAARRISRPAVANLFQGQTARQSSQP